MSDLATIIEAQHFLDAHHIICEIEVGPAGTFRDAIRLVAHHAGGPEEKGEPIAMLITKETARDLAAMLEGVLEQTDD
jgi:hypothetical protein